ncbi:MAG: helix-turn-helix domain-containing protein [Candidatus Glassbacteria bacterium]
MLKDILKSRMRELGLNYAKLAKLAGISDVYVGKIISGSRVPSARILKALSEALDLDYNLLRIEAYKQKAPKGINVVFSNDESLSEIKIKDAGLKNIPVLTPESWDNARDIQYMIKSLDSIETIEPSFSDDPQAFWVMVPESSKGNGMIGGRIGAGDYLLIEPNKEPSNGNYVLTLGEHKVGISIFYETEKGKFYVPINAMGNPPDYFSGKELGYTHYRISRILTKFH